MTPDFEINMQQHCHIIYLIYAAFYSTSVTWSTWTICSLELQKHREITQILLLESFFACESNYYYWYSGFQVTAMIEWGKNKNPQKCLDQNLISNKSHAEFPSHKHSLKAWYKNPYSKNTLIPWPIGKISFVTTKAVGWWKEVERSCNLHCARIHQKRTYQWEGTHTLASSALNFTR